MVNQAHNPMAGQWLGTVAGDSNTGSLILNIDTDRPEVGWFLVDDSVAPFAASTTIAITGSKVFGELSQWISRPYFGQAQPYDTSTALFPISGRFEGTLDDKCLVGTWQTEIPGAPQGTSGTFEIRKVDKSEPRPPDAVLRWKDFLEWALAEREQKPRAIFRGHQLASDALETSFNRTGRRSLLRYLLEDVTRLKNVLEPTLKRSVNFDDGYEFGAFLNNAQHHGFPTPLQDWTDSPFVAAFFAFRKAATNRYPRSSSFARVFSFDLARWNRPLGDTNILDVRPLFQELRLGAPYNPRAVPQQSVNMFSNIADIETFIETRTSHEPEPILKRIDIEFSERTTVMRDLKAMNISAASLFPGIDGVCEAVAQESFNR